VDKYLRSVEVDLDTDNASRFCEIYYTLNPRDSNPTWTLLGAYTALGRSEVSFPADTECREVQIEVRLTTNDATITPAVLRVALNYTERLEKNTVYTAACRVGYNVEDGSGSGGHIGPETIVNRIEGYEGAGKITVTGPTGQTFNALVLEVQTEEYANIDNEDDPYYTMRITMLKVP
jgi:hypothetical protein